MKKTKVQVNESTRTTIPKFIADHFGIKDGDRVKWELVTKGTHSGKAFIEKVEEVEE